MAQRKQDLMQEISQIIIDTSKQQRKDFREENIILELCCKSPNAQPRVIAEQYNSLVPGAGKTGNDIIRIFRMCKLDRITERISLLRQSNHSAQQIHEAIEQRDPAAIETVKRDLPPHIQAKRLTLLALAILWKPGFVNDAYHYLLRMNRDFANECLDTILDLVGAQQDTPKKIPETNLTSETYEEEIYRLTASLNRANNLVTRLQDSYEEQMIEIRAEESIRLISMLNSEKYGYILDLLFSAQDGFRQLRKKGPVPFEIKSVQSLTRRLMEFVEDCGIAPMLEVGEQLSVRANELDGYTYDGTPFSGPDDTKKVEVISPGWRAPEKEIVISYPRVKEIVEEA